MPVVYKILITAAHRVLPLYPTAITVLHPHLHQPKTGFLKVDFVNHDDSKHDCDHDYDHGHDVDHDTDHNMTMTMTIVARATQWPGRGWLRAGQE